MRIIGCGLCLTGCPNGAARLLRKPEKELVAPQIDLKYGNSNGFRTEV